LVLLNYIAGTWQRQRRKVLECSDGERLGGNRMAKIVIGVFHDFMTVLNVMPDLVQAGIPRKHISAIAQEKSAQYTHSSHTSLARDARMENGVDVSRGLGVLLSDTVALSIPGIGFLVAVGPLAHAIAGPHADAITGGFVGALNSLGVLEREARAYEVA